MILEFPCNCADCEATHRSRGHEESSDKTNLLGAVAYRTHPLGKLRYRRVHDGKEGTTKNMNPRIVLLVRIIL